MKVDFWPKGVERVQTLAAFIAAYETLGYEACDSGDAEVGFEKVAIFLKPGARPLTRQGSLPTAGGPASLETTRTSHTTSVA